MYSDSSNSSLNIPTEAVFSIRQVFTSTNIVPGSTSHAILSPDDSLETISRSFLVNVTQLSVIINSSTSRIRILSGIFIVESL